MTVSNFAGKSAVIVGGSTGIGKALVDRCVAEGMSVALVGVDHVANSGRSAELRNQGVNAFAVAADITQRDQIQKAADECFERFGSLDLVFLNAGIQRQGSFLEVPLDDHLRMITTNLVGLTIALKTFLGPMVASNGDGRIIVTASSCSIFTPMNLSSYNASKGGVLNLVETVHHELESMGSRVRLSLMLPGAVRSNLHDWGRYGFANDMDDATADTLNRNEAKLRHVLAKYGKDPVDVADVVFAGIEADRFWLLPHPDIVDLARQRMDRFYAQENPRLPISG